MPPVRQPATAPLPEEAFKPLPETFVKAGRAFRLIKREGNAALYSIRLSPTPDWSKPDWAWEVVIIRQVFTGRFIKGYWMPPHEELPSEAQWGSRGFSPNTLERAEELFRGLVKKRA